MSTDSLPPQQAAGWVWLITGASSGLGRALAEAALAGARFLRRCRRLFGDQVRPRRPVRGPRRRVAPFGIKVLIVEPGAFRTGLHRTGTRQETAAIPAYNDIIGPVRAQHAAFDGKQPGDPPKAAAIITTLSADTTAELAAWDEVTRGTDLDQ